MLYENKAMPKLFSLLKRYWVWLVLAPVAMALEVSMDLMQPALMSRIIDEGIANGSPQIIAQYGGRMMLCAFVGLFGGFGCAVFSNCAALGFGNDLRQLLFKHIQGFAFAETDHFTAGSLVTRLTNDVNVLQHLVNMFSVMIIRSPLLLVGSVILVLTTDAKIAIPLLIAAPILATVVVWKIRRVQPQFKKIQARIDDVNTTMQENLTGIRIVKTFSNEDGERQRFNEANIQLTETSIRTGYMMVTLGPWLSVIQHAAIIVILFIAAGDINMRLIKVGQVAAIVNYSMQVMTALVGLSFHTMHISRAGVSANRINEVLETVPSIADGTRKTPPDNGSITFNAVSFHYPRAAGRPVLDTLSLNIADGEYVAFMGATGSGKTSLINLIPRFYDTVSGDVCVGGINVRGYTLHALRSTIGFVMQDTRLFSGTIGENIRWGNEQATDEDIERVARIASAHTFITACPNGYDTHVAQGGVTLSGGQKQRIAIARALLIKPRILILDDSTSALDVTTEAAIQKALRSEMHGATILKVAQRIRSVLDADRVVLLEDGKISAIGPHRTLIYSSDTYRAICDSQNMLQEVPHVC